MGCGGMRISAKGRYALAAVIFMANHQHDAEPMTVSKVSTELNISKIYLEQVFALLKRGGFVKSVKGAQGGYWLNRKPEDISAYDIMHVAEGVLFEGAQDVVLESAPEIDRVIRDEIIGELDESIKVVLGRISIASLAEKTRREPAHMYYI